MWEPQWCRLLLNITIHTPRYLPDTPGIGFEKRAYIVLENAGEARVCITTNVTLNANSVVGFVTTYTEDITATGMYVNAFKVMVVQLQLTVQYYYNIPCAVKFAGCEWNGYMYFLNVFTYVLCLYYINPTVHVMIAYLVGHCPMLTAQLPVLFDEQDFGNATHDFLLSNPLSMSLPLMFSLLFTTTTSVSLCTLSP